MKRCTLCGHELRPTNIILICHTNPACRVAAQQVHSRRATKRRIELRAARRANLGIQQADPDPDPCRPARGLPEIGRTTTIWDSARSSFVAPAGILKKTTSGQNYVRPHKRRADPRSEEAV